MNRPPEPSPPPDPSAHRGIGYRFRRPLTDAELETITSAAKRRGKDGGLDGAFRATWDILLGEAEGLTMDEAIERGLKFHPAEYAIPESQSETLLGIWLRHRGPRYPQGVCCRVLVAKHGPGTYPDDNSDSTRS